MIIPQLENSIKRFKGLKLYDEDGKGYLTTQEGIRAYQEAITYLKSARPQPPLKWSDDLEKAASEHLSDICPLGLTCNSSSDGTKTLNRIEKYGHINVCWADSLQFGALSTKELLERLIVCDGDPKRDHRNSLFCKNFTLCGVATSSHSKLETAVELIYVG